MRLRLLAVPVLMVLIFARLASAQEYERILLPVVTAPTAGGYGSVWKSFLAVYNGSDTDASFEYSFGCPLGTCPRGVVVPAHTVQDTRNLVPPLPGTPGLLVYASKPQSGSFAFNLRVQDLSRQSLTWGTELPAIRESDARTGLTNLLSIPTDDRFRLLLRVYDFDSRPQSVVHVRVLPMTSDVPLAELDVILVRPYDENVERPFNPGYASISDITQLPGVQGQEQIRLELRPVTDGLRYWAFVSVTNNETQHVTTITPQ